MKAPPSPDPEQVAELRHALGMTQVEAAALIYVTPRRWQMWEQAIHPMHPALWELFGQKARAILKHRANGPAGA